VIDGPSSQALCGNEISVAIARDNSRGVRIPSRASASYAVVISGTITNNNHNDDGGGGGGR